LPPFCEAAEGNGGSEQGLGSRSARLKYEWRKDRKHRHSNYTIRNLLGTAGHGFGPQAPSYIHQAGFQVSYSFKRQAESGNEFRRTIN